MPLESARLLGALTGWRAWGLDGDFLLSVRARKRWDGPVMTTKTGPDGTHRPPSSRSPDLVATDFGVHSYKSPLLLNRYLPLAIVDVVGRIDVYGLVVEHEYCWRSQYAIVRELWVVQWWNVDDEALVRLGNRYDCAVNRLAQADRKSWIDRCSGAGAS